MTEFTIQRRRTGWDIVWGILLIIGGLIILGDVVIATAVSILFIGWLALISGIVGVVASFFKIGKGGGFWSTLLTGALVGVLGLMILRHPEIGAGVITLMAGIIFMVGGIVRLIAGFEPSPARWVLILSGVAGIVLGLIVLFNPVQSTYVLLGILLGVQVLVDGITLIMFGRVHVDTTSPVTA